MRRTGGAAKEKAAHSRHNFRSSSDLVRVERVELSFLPWEGSIIAVIRYPHCYLLYDYSKNPTTFGEIHTLVAPPRLELGTRGSSGRCSTN